MIFKRVGEGKKTIQKFCKRNICKRHASSQMGSPDLKNK
jgi:hypothetical protein